MSPFPLQSLLEDLVAFLDRHGIDYMIMGGVSVRFWGIPRPTYDLDFTLAVPPERVPALCAELRQCGFAIPEAHEKGHVDVLAGMRKFAAARFIDGREVRVDLFLVTTRYQREAFGRRVRKKIDGREAWLISPEDLILHKLIAGRERDLADITDVLWMNPGADTAYLRKWAGELSVADALEKKLSEPLP